MAVVVSEFSSWVSLNNSSNYTCMANITLPTNQLIIAAVKIHAASNLTINNVTGCGLTWNSVTSTKFNTTFGQLSLWTARGTPSVGTVHVALSGTCQNCFVTLLQCTGESGILTQSSTSTGIGLSTLSTTLSSFSSTGNATVYVASYMSSTAVMNPRAGLIKLVDVLGSGTGGDSGDLCSAWSAKNVLTSGITWTTVGDCAGIACEINVAAAGGAAVSPYYSSYYGHVVTGVA